MPAPPPARMPFRNGFSAVVLPILPAGSVSHASADHEDQVRPSALECAVMHRSLCDTATGRLWLFHKSRLVPCILQVKCKIELSSGKGLSDFVELPDPFVYLKAKFAAHRNQKFRPLNHTRISTSIRSTASRSDHNSHTK